MLSEHAYAEEATYTISFNVQLSMSYELAISKSLIRTVIPFVDIKYASKKLDNLLIYVIINMCMWDGFNSEVDWYRKEKSCLKCMGNAKIVFTKSKAGIGKRKVNSERPDNTFYLLKICCLTRMHNEEDCRQIDGRQIFYKEWSD
uniref:Uncharacterized protein n=1 Tax=Glossina pallidipes TaxID=7398 RepID=A0A1B0AEW4_GLOPL